jgi:flagellar motility protein MotE (MotC chaperone)
MKSRSPILMVALLAALLNLTTTAGLIYLKGNKFNAAAGLLEDKPASVTLWSFKPTEIDGMINELKEEKGKLDAREVDLGKVEARIKAEKAELEKVRSDIETMRDQISETIPQIEESEAKNIKALAKTYSSVKPSAAVTIFKEMNDNTIAKILSFMKADTAGAILAEMSKQQDKEESMAIRAARISDKLRLLQPLKKETPQT